MKVFCTIMLALAISCRGGTTPQSASRPARAPDPPVGKLEAPKPRFPPTPAGKTMRAWFDAFNSGDEVRIKEFAATYNYPKPDELVAFRKRTGGFELITLGTVWGLEVKFVVKEKNSPTKVVGRLRVTDTDPAVIETLELDVAPPGITGDDDR